MNTDRSNCILLFVKSPITGKVKTRLAAEIGHEAAIGLYTCFVEDLVAMVEEFGGALRLCFDPPEAKSDLLQWLGEQYSYSPQEGDELGEKLKNAFAAAFAQGFSKVVAIGSDSPDLPEDFLRQAFEQLESHDAVIGPSSDGGYYLIGFSAGSFVGEAFDNIAWSTSAVCDQTQMRLRTLELNVHLLPLWHDVDTRSDLESLAARNENTSFGLSRTFAFIRKIENLKQRRIP
ncbi:MAG: TIGR04282 family arsenosugar biosynthesis glycosyltransferase [Planctomycetota bacterium]|jgi:rSAM/selenodomain-associated transferase 1